MRSTEFIIGFLVAALAICLVVIALMHDHLQRYRREIRTYQIDDLTGLYAQRTADGALRRAEDDPNLCISVFDLANFKLVNDALGHLEGDRRLQVVGGVVNDVLDQLGLPRRFGIRKGGDEIVVIAPQELGWAVVNAIEYHYVEVVGDQPIKISNGRFRDRIVGASSGPRSPSDVGAPAGRKYVQAEKAMEHNKLRLLLMQHRAGLLMSRAFDPEDAQRRIEAWYDEQAS